MTNHTDLQTSGKYLHKVLPSLRESPAWELFFDSLASELSLNLKSYMTVHGLPMIIDSEHLEVLKTSNVLNLAGSQSINESVEYYTFNIDFDEQQVYVKGARISTNDIVSQGDLDTEVLTTISPSSKIWVYSGQDFYVMPVDAPTEVSYQAFRDYLVQVAKYGFETSSTYDYIDSQLFHKVTNSSLQSGGNMRGFQIDFGDSAECVDFQKVVLVLNNTITMVVTADNWSFITSNQVTVSTNDGFVRLVTTGGGYAFARFKYTISIPMAYPATVLTTVYYRHAALSSDATITFGYFHALQASSAIRLPVQCSSWETTDQGLILPPGITPSASLKSVLRFLQFFKIKYKIRYTFEGQDAKNAIKINAQTVSQIVSVKDNVSYIYYPSDVGISSYIYNDSYSCLHVGSSNYAIIGYDKNLVCLQEIAADVAQDYVVMTDGDYVPLAVTDNSTTKILMVSQSLSADGFLIYRDGLYLYPESKFESEDGTIQEMSLDKTFYICVYNDLDFNFLTRYKDYITPVRTEISIEHA